MQKSGVYEQVLEKYKAQKKLMKEVCLQNLVPQ